MVIRQAHLPEHAAILDLVLHRCAHLNRALVEPAVIDPSATEDRTLLAAYDDGGLVGVGLQYHGIGIAPGRLYRLLVVADAALGSGLGSALQRELDAALPPDAVATSGEIDDRDQHALAVAEHWGYSVTQHSVTSRLGLAGVPEPALPAGVSVEVSPRLAVADEAAVEAMYAASQTNPEVAQTGVLTLAALRAMAAETAGVLPVGLVVRDAGRPVALSFAIVADGEAQVVYTGVRPDARGRGLARLAKQALHVAAARLGASSAVTDNEDDNAGIRAVNAALGYRRVLGRYWVSRAVAR
ncbi:MAG: hypothetical protein R2731_05655 [Nocardioides sp.]